VGGAFGQKMVMPDQRMLEQVRDMVNKMDMKSGLVVPFYVNVETHGTDGQVLNVEDKVKAGSRYFCESLFWASQPKQAAKT
jgi:hypothetical protein